MKILVIYIEGKTAKAGDLKTLIKQKGVNIEYFPLLPSEKAGGSIETQLASYFTLSVFDEEDLIYPLIPSHTLIISPLSNHCFDFLAGFSCASRLPFPVFYDEAIAQIPTEFSYCFKPIKTEEELLSYIKTENEAYIRSESERSANKAREKLLNMGISINVESLVKSVSEGRIDEIALFLASGFSPDTLDNNGIPLLNLAARNGKREAIRFLIHAGTQLDLLSHDRGSSALMDSVMKKNNRIARDLIKAGADVSIQSKDGQSALIIAVGNNDEKVVEALLKAGANPDVADKLGATARKYAELFKNENIMGLMNAYPPIPEEEDQETQEQ